MNDSAFHHFAVFLEQKIQDFPENVEFVKAYVALIEQKTQFDIAVSLHAAGLQKAIDNNKAKVSMAANSNTTKVAIKHIEFG